MRDVASVLGDANAHSLEIVGYWSDVTDQVRVEAAVRRSEANFRTLIERAPVASFVHRVGQILYVNPAAVAMLGHQSATDIVGRSILEFVHPDDRDDVTKRIAALANGGAVPTGGARLVRADGSTLVMEVDSVLLDFDGEPANVVMGHDVTQRDETFARIAMA